jgi:hypothetical protein
LGQKRHKLLRLPATKSATEHMGKIVPTREIDRYWMDCPIGAVVLKFSHVCANGSRSGCPRGYHLFVQPFSNSGFLIPTGRRVTPLLRAAFEGRGETITGRKIGFTNRQMWKAFGVESPIWGYTTSRTTQELADMQVMSLNDFSEPRIEPEIMFGLGAEPAPSMSYSALIDCIE